MAEPSHRPSTALEQQQAERRRAARLAIAETIATAPSLQPAVSGILQAVCEALAWDVGALWLLERGSTGAEDVLRCREFWKRPGIAVVAFESMTVCTELARGAGLPGRVWSSGGPAWIPDVTHDGNFPRASAALASNLHSAFGFPIRAGAEFLGVIEFFSREIREPDGDLLEMMTTTGSLLGQFLKRELAAQALRESEHRFAGFMQHLPGLAWIKDAAGRYVYANDAAERAFGTPRVALYGKSDHDLFPPQTAAQFVANDEQARRSPTGIQAVETLEHEGGVIHHSLVSKFPIPAPDRADSLIAGVAIDITELKAAEQALRESEERFRGIFQQAAVGVGRSSLDRVLIDVNPGLCQMLGYSREELVGRSILTISHPDEWASSGEQMQPLFAGQIQQVVMDRRYLHKQGHYVWTQTTASLIRDKDGQPESIVAVVQDLTERKRSQAALLEADRRKDEFLATLAHELRNPLAPIVNSLNILRLAGGDAAAHESLLAMMERQVNHLVRLVDDLLEISRITRDRIELRRERIELAAVIRTAVEASRPNIDAGGHNLAISLPSEPVTLLADPVRLSQIFANLLNNAAKYTNKGGQIWLTAHVAAGDPGEVTIAVRDSGIGIPPEMLSNVFEMFAQVDRSMRRTQGGLGIGLTLVRRLVELHGGNVLAKSEGTGKGSEFVVRLPLAEADLGEVALLDDRADAPWNDAGLRPLRILVVDDNRDAADSLAVLLTRLGAEPRVVYGGRAALEALASFRPELILLDLGMPEMTGFDVAAAVRSRPEWAEVSLVALTGWGQDHDRQKSAAAGFAHHLVKPVDVQQLQTVLAAIALKPEAPAKV